jgi:hypothetical protein
MPPPPAGSPARTPRHARVAHASRSLAGSRRLHSNACRSPQCDRPPGRSAAEAHGTERPSQVGFDRRHIPFLRMQTRSRPSPNISRAPRPCSRTAFRLNFVVCARHTFAH